jgi:hypothetical protein
MYLQTSAMAAQRCYQPTDLRRSLENRSLPTERRKIISGHSLPMNRACICRIASCSCNSSPA